MRRISQTLLLTTAITIFAACNDNAKHAGEHEATVSTGKDAAAQEAAPVKLKDDKLNAVYQHYVHLTTALTNGDAAEAKLAASAIEVGAKEVNGGSRIASSASEIVSAKDIDAQRTIYSTLSNEMITLVKQSGLASGEVYIDHCPMAMNDKGADWISNTKEIRNPYFGDKMMNCGEIKETVK